MSETVQPGTAADRLRASLASVMQGQERATRLLLSALISGGHVLLEDYPGTGKTTLAKALAASLEARFKRIQFTPDLLPSDILGVSVFEPDKGSFRFQPGPVFGQVVLADEINRASPRTQSALLEAMGEGQVSVDGELRPLDGLFFVIATQNPVEFHGTYPLPEAQLDRFALRFSLGYVSLEQELAILSAQQYAHPLNQVTACATVDELLALRQQAQQVSISDELRRYMVELSASTRRREGIALGASPRATLAWMKCAQALALLDGLDFVTPEQLQELAVPVLAHRLVLESQARFAGQSAEALVEALLDELPVPV